MRSQPGKEQKEIQEVVRGRRKESVKVRRGRAEHLVEE